MIFGIHLLTSLLSPSLGPSSFYVSKKQQLASDNFVFLSNSSCFSFLNLVQAFYRTGYDQLVGWMGCVFELVSWAQIRWFFEKSSILFKGVMNLWSIGIFLLKKIEFFVDLIIGVYSLCDGPGLSRGPYLGIATICSVSSLVFVSLKASYVFAHNSSMDRGGYVRAVEMALFVCSLVLAVAHVLVAYRISCRERRKLLVYKIDVEAVS